MRRQARTDRRSETFPITRAAVRDHGPPRLTPPGASLLRGTGAGRQSAVVSAWRVPRERCAHSGDGTAPRGRCPISESSDLCPARTRRRARRSETGAFPGIGPPGTARQYLAGSWHATRTPPRGGVRADDRSWGAAIPYRDLAVEGRTFRPACSRFPRCLRSEARVQTPRRRALDPQPRACRRSQRRVQPDRPRSPPSGSTRRCRRCVPTGCPN